MIEIYKHTFVLENKESLIFNQCIFIKQILDYFADLQIDIKAID